MQTPCIIAPVLSTKGYSVDWRDIVRPSVLKRDKYQCVHCSVVNRSLYSIEGDRRIIVDDDWLIKVYISKGIRLYKVALQISHQCHNKACINQSHLITLCSSCHLRYDKHIHVLNRLKNAAQKKSI
jgi:5-methylcytosine-specific restriction endonuclease McrA